MGNGSSDRVAVGYVTGTKGVRGAVRVEILTHSLSRFDEIAQVVLQKEGRKDLPLQIEDWRPERRGIVVKFAGVDAPETAREVLVKGYITIAPGEVPSPPSGKYYISDLIGCRVEDEAGRHLGEIVDVLQEPSTDAYVVKDGGNEFLVPAVADFIVDLSVTGRRLVVRGIEELLKPL